MDILAPSRIENKSVAIPGSAAEDVEISKTSKYVCLTDKEYIFQRLALDIQGGVGPSTSTFLKVLCKKLCVYNQENSRVVFQGLSLAIQAGNAASVVAMGLERRPFQRTLLLVNLRLMTALFQQEICCLSFVIVSFSRASWSL